MNAYLVGYASCARLSLDTSVVGLTYLFDVSPHLIQEWLDTIEGCGINRLPVVEPETDPQIIHEHRKANYHSSYAPRTTEFIAKTRLCFLIDFVGLDLRLMAIQSLIQKSTLFCRFRLCFL